MADVRSLLRKERAWRRIDHPQALYSAAGNLECKVCRIPLKSDDKTWNLHLKSTQHAMRAERLRLSATSPTKTTDAVTTTREVSDGSKKRKAADMDDISRRKRRVDEREEVPINTSRPMMEPPGGFVDELIETNNANTQSEARVSRNREGTVEDGTDTQALTQIRTTTAVGDTVDEDEWAAFERDIATPPKLTSSAPTVLTAAATISAAPLTADDLAAQPGEQASRQGREQREAELDAEKEDATRALEEEFDEMESLEEKVRNMKEKREQLRMKTASGLANDGNAIAYNDVLSDAAVDKSDPESGDEDFDDWSFR